MICTDAKYASASAFVRSFSAACATVVTFSSLRGCVVVLKTP